MNARLASVAANDINSVDHAHDAVVKACSEYARLTCEDDMLDLLADIHMQHATLTKDDVVKRV